MLPERHLHAKEVAVTKLAAECVFSLFNSPCCRFPCGSSSSSQGLSSPSLFHMIKDTSIRLSIVVALYTPDPNPPKQAGRRKMSQHHAGNMETPTWPQGEIMASLISTDLAHQS